MNKIIALSSNGFKIDAYLDEGDMITDVRKNTWFTCDKKRIIDSGKFNLLKVGLELSLITFSKDGKYVIDFIIETSNIAKAGRDLLERDGGNTISSLNKQNSLNSPSSVQDLNSEVVVVPPGSQTNEVSEEVKPPNVFSSSDSIKKKDGMMYGQSINLAFNNLNSQEVALNFKTDKGYPNIVLGFNPADLIYAEMLRRI